MMIMMVVVVVVVVMIHDALQERQGRDGGG